MPATKPRAYQVYDIDWKQAVRAVSTSNIDLVSPGPLVVDAVVLDPYDRVLLVAQTNPKENGIYQADASLTYLEPAPDFINIASGLSSAVNAGLTVSVTAGTLYAQTTWTLTSPNPIIIGITDITFEEVSGGADVLGNIFVDGTTIQIDPLAPETNIMIKPSGPAGAVGITIPNDETANTVNLQIYNNVTNGNVEISTIGGNWLFNGSGDLVGTGDLYAADITSSGSITGENITANADINANNIFVSNEVNASGNITGENVISNGAVTGSALDITGNAAVGNVNATGEIVAVGNIIGNNLSIDSTISATDIVSTTASATGNIEGGNLITSGNAEVNSLLVSNSIEAAAGASPAPTISGFDSASFAGNISAGNVLATNGVYAQTLEAANAIIDNLTVNSNITANNIQTATITAGQISTTGNISGDYILGNGSLLTGLPEGYSNTKVAAFLANFGSNSISTSGTITSGPMSVTGNVNVTGNVTVTGNLNYANVTDLVVGDPLIYLGANNTGNVYDLGIVVSWDDGLYQHGGWVRDASDGLWKLFSNVTTEPTTVIDWTEAIYAGFKSGSILSNASITANANITAIGNVQGDFILGNGRYLAGMYGNADVAAYLPTYTGNLANSSDIIALYANAVAQSNAIANNTSNITLLQNDVGNINNEIGNLWGNASEQANSINIINGDISNLWANVANQSNAIANLEATQYGNTNVAAYLQDLSSNVTTTANIQANYFIGNGAFLTGISANYNDANVTSLLSNFGTNSISTTGNITANYFIGDGSQLTNLPSGTNYSNANAAAYGEAGWSGNIIPAANSVYSLGDSTNYWSNLWVANNTIYIGGVPLGITAGNILTVGGNAVLINDSNADIVTSGNVTANYFIGDGSLLTGISANSNYSNSNVASFLSDFGSNSISTAGNISSDNLNANDIQAINLTTTGLVNLNGGTPYTTAAMGGGNLILNNGTNNTPGLHFYQGDNDNFGMDVEGGTIRFFKNLDELGGQLLARINFDGNITAVGELQGATASVLGNITGANINTTGEITATGNITGANINGTNISATGTVVATGNIAGNNINTTGEITATGNITGNNLIAINDVVANNITITGNITANGNISGDYLLGNGVYLTGMPVPYGDANVISLLSDFGSNSISTSGSLTAGNTQINGNLDVAGNLNITGNLTYANINNLNIGDPLIYLGANNTGNVYDLGMVVSYDDGVYQHGGWVRDASDGTWKLFGNVVPEPTTTVDFANAIYQPMQAGAITATSGSYSLTLDATGNITGGNLVTAGNVSGNYIFGNGYYLTGITGGGGSNYTDANVVSLMSTFGSNTITTTGNIAGGNISGTDISGINVSVTGTVTATGNITGGNVNTAGQVIATGNITGGNLITTGIVSTDTGISLTSDGAPRSIIWTGSYPSYLQSKSGTNGFIYLVPGNAGRGVKINYAGQTQFEDTTNSTSYLNGAVTIAGGLGVVGNINSGNEINAVGNVIAGNLNSNGTIVGVSATIAGNIVTSNLTVNNILSTPAINVTGNVNTGNLLITDVVQATGNILGGNLISNQDMYVSDNLYAASMQSQNDGTNGYDITIVASSAVDTDGNGGSIILNAGDGNGLGTSGNVLIDAGLGGAILIGTANTANIYLGGAPGYPVNIPTTFAGNIQAGNITATGNISGTYILGNGAYLTGLPASYSNANVIALLANFDGNPISTTGAVSAGNTSVTGNLNVTGNINVTGNVNYSNVTDLIVGDPLIYIGANNTGNVYDLGMVVSYNDGTYQHGGWVRDASDGTWKLFGNVVPEPTTTVDFTNAIYQPMQAGAITATSGSYSLGLTATGNITGGNLNSNAAVTGTSATFSGNITGGNLNSNAAITGTSATFSGNITGGNLNSNAAITGTSVTVSGTVTAGTLTSNGAINGVTITTTGNATFGNISTAGQINATGNIRGGNLIANANVSAGNISSTGIITATGNITSSGNVSGGNLIATGNVVGNVSGFAIGYRDIPQLTLSSNTTISTTDAGKHYYSTASSLLTLTIANNASQPFQVGATINIVNQGVANISILRGSGVTLYLAGNSISSDRTLITYGVASFTKVATDTWFITGVGLV